MTKADICQFVAKQKLGVLGSISSGGSPQSALVGIAVTPEFEIIFDTIKSAQVSESVLPHLRSGHGQRARGYRGWNDGQDSSGGRVEISLLKNDLLNSAQR